MRFYEATFLTKKGGDQHWIIHVEAANVAEAKAKVKKMWHDDKGLNTMHQFWLEAHRLPDTEEFRFHYFKRQ